MNDLHFDGAKGFEDLKIIVVRGKIREKFV
jgi:hypothetical protein